MILVQELIFIKLKVTTKMNKDNPHKFKVLILTHDLKPDSGWGRYSLSIVEELKKKKIEFKVLTTADGLSLGRVRQAARDCQIVHAFDGWPYAFWGYWAVLGTKKKLFINGVGTYTISPLGHLLKGFILRLAYARAERIFCISEYVAKRLKELVPKAKVDVVHLGTTILKPAPAPIILEVKDRFRLKDHFPILLTVGEVKSRKGQLEVLKSLPSLVKNYPTLKYLVVGRSQDLSYREEMINYARAHNLENNWQLITDIKDDQFLAALYELCDVFVLAALNDGRHFEGFGLVLLEANAFGKVVVGNKWCGIEDAIKDGYNGYLSIPNNTNSLTESILKAISNKEQIASQAKHWSEGFSWEKTVENYIKYYA